MPFFFSGADESRPRRFFAFPDWPQTGSPFLLYLFEVFCIFLVINNFLASLSVFFMQYALTFSSKCCIF